MSNSNCSEPSIFAVDRIPNALLVLLAIALLLQGPVGAFEALWGYTFDLVRAIFGGEDLLLEVLCQTAPLSLAVAVAVFSFRSGWISPDSPAAVVASAALILAGTWIGGELRSTASSSTVPVQAELVPTDADNSPSVGVVRPVSIREQTGMALSEHSLQSLANPTEDADAEEANRSSETISVAQAWAVLSDLETVATDGSHHHWDQPVPRVDLIPESETLWGMVGRAINQLLGYFVVYRPRLFLAAVLLGSYIGWSWQPYFESLRSWVRDRTDRPVSASQ